MKSEAKSDIDKEDLICPITLQMFRDPVVAGDGQTYERAAIVQWITEHGTSPITRQPLNINELQSDDYLRNLAALRRTSSVPCNYDKNISHPTVERQSSTISYNYNISVRLPDLMQLPTIHHDRSAPIDSARSFYAHSDSVCWLGKYITALVIIVFLIAYFMIRSEHFSRTDSTYFSKFLVNILFILIYVLRRFEGLINVSLIFVTLNTLFSKATDT
jgi:hypothetical protein